MADLITDLSQVIPGDLRKEVTQELLSGWRKAEVDAKVQAEKHARFNRRNEANNIEGIGRKVASIPGVAYHYWGQRLGYECWEDKQFIKEFLRDNPEVAVTNYAKKAAVHGAIFTGDGFIHR